MMFFLAFLMMMTCASALLYGVMAMICGAAKPSNWPTGYRWIFVFVWLAALVWIGSSAVVAAEKSGVLW